MAIAKLFKWNALVLISFFLIACSDSGGGSGSSRGLETPIGHSIIEGNEGTSVLTLYFISPVDGPLTYSTFNITAAEKSDYELLADTFQAEKDKEYAFDVIVYGDTQIEGDESLGINFKNAQGESVGTIIGSIINDDYPGLSVTSPQVIEGDTGTPKLVFTFALSAAVVDDYSITVSSIGESGSVPSAFANLATPEIDFLPVSQELVFKSGELEKQLEVSVYADNLIENDETVVLKVLREDQPKLAELYASGIIRTDETPEINGFQLSVKDGEQQTDITEGSSINPFELTWKKIDYEITVSKPQNILQEQNLVFTLLPFTEAQTQYGVTYEKQNYVNLTDSHDLCFNDLSLDNALECQTSLNYILKQDEASFVVSIYVKEDITRELSEIFIMNIGNDQNVLFSNFQAKIINDDSENLQIKIGDEFVDLKTFTSNQSVYELTEPRAATQGTAKVIEENTLTFRLNSPLDIKYSPEYELNKYFKERPADNGEYSYADENKTLIFSTDREAPQDVTLGINLESDGTYDGDKYITLTFKETDISPLIIKIIDSDYPKLEATTKQAGVNQDSIVDNGFSYIELLEQPSAESKANEDGYMEYQYTLSQGVAAEPLLSDIRYKVTLQNAGIGKGETLPELTCLSPGHTQEYNLATLTGDDSDVSIFDNKGTQIPSGGEILLEEGATSYDLTIRVKNDAAIECQEVFQLTVVPALAPEGIQAEVALSQNFIIKDTDKALVTVQSWQTAETDAATKTQNFQFNANKKVNAILTPILTGQGLNCNADDLNPPTDAATTVSLTPDSLEPTFPIYIKGDTTIEPDEACELKIGTLSADLETLIEVQYLDLTGAVKEVESEQYATGLIENDDKLSISFDIATQVAEPTNKNVKTGLGYIHWSSNNNIAENVGNIIVTFANEACSNNADDCIEYSAAADAETDIKISLDSFYLNDAVLNQTNNRFEKALPISILGDDIVESLETLNISVNSDPVYVQSIPSVITTKIVNEDKLTISFTENTLSPLMAASNGSESGSRFYDITWGEKTVASTVPEITLNLHHNDSTAPGVATRNVAAKNASGAPKEFDYSLDVAGSLNVSNQLTLKESGSDLQSNGSLRVELILEDDSIIEEIETVDFTLSSTLTDFINAFTFTKSHEIGIDDKLLVEFTPPDDYTNNNMGSSEEKNEKTIEYSIGVTGIVDSDVPELKLGLTNTGNADLFENNDGDYTFNIAGSVYENNFITIKEVNSGLASSSIMLTLNIKEDDHVEVQERIITTLSNNAVNFNYIELKDTAETIVDSIQFTHYIFSEDLTNFSIEQAAGGVSTSKEEDEVTNTYILSWANPIGKNVPSLVFDLPFSGSAIKNSDYTLTARDASKLTITDFEIPSNPTVTVERLTINKAENAVLSAGSVLLDVKIVDDVDVEGDEVVTASFKPLDESFPDTHHDMPYLTFSDIKNSFSHTIISEEGVTVTLTKSTASLSGLERDEREIFYTLSWTQAIEKSVGDIPVQIVFGGSADVTSDYSVESSDNGKLTVDALTGIFTIKNKGSGLSANGSVEFKVTLIDEDLVEPQETIELSLNTHGTTPSIIGVETAGDTTYTILIDSNSDKTQLNLTETSNKPTFSNERDKTVFDYKLEWKKPVASNAPVMFVDIPLTGSASMDDMIVEADSPAILTIIRGDDDSILSPVPLKGYRLIFKKAGESIAKDGSVTFKVRVNKDNIVEINEDLSGSISIPDSLLDYAKLGSNISLSPHTIINDDKLTLSLIPDINNPASSTEDDTQILGFTLSWDKQVASNVPALIVDLPMSSNASLADFTVASTDAGLAVSGDEYTFKKDNIALDSKGSVTFSYTVINDNEVEIAEEIKSAITLDASISQYIEEPTINNSLSHTINPDSDKTVISLTKVVGTLDAADEESESSISYNLAWTNPVAKDVPALSVDLNLSDSNATEGDTKDYIVDPLPSGLARAGDTFTFKAADTALAENGSYTLSFTINDDDIVETDEIIEGELAYSGNLSTYAGLSETNFAFSHTITNKDKTTLSLVMDSGSSSSLEGSEDTTTYNLVSSHAVANDVTSLKVTMPITGTATAASDYIFTDMTLSKAADVYTIPTPITARARINSFSITVDDEELVEANETFIATLALQPETESVAELVGASKSVTHTITNDDFINIVINTGLTEGDAVTYTVGDYQSSGLSDTIVQAITATQITPSFKLTGTHADIPASLGSISHTIASAHTSNTTHLFTLEDGDNVEPSESFRISLANLFTHAQYLKVNGETLSSTSTVDIEVTDNDAIGISYNKYHVEDTGVTDNPYSVQLCYTAGAVIEGGTTIPLTLSLYARTDSGSDILKVKWAESNDIASQENQLNIDTVSGFTVNGSEQCKEVEIFATKQDLNAEGTEWLNVTLNSDDTRLKGADFGGTGVDVVILDNDYPFMTQTGADKCITAAGNLDTTNCLAGSAQDFNRDEIANHPEQHFTLISNGLNIEVGTDAPVSGDLSQVAPSAVTAANFNGDNGYCLLDSYTNSMWLVGGFYVNTNLNLKSTERIQFYDDNTSVKTALSIQTQAQTGLSWCGLSSGDSHEWRLPTVAELLTILNIENLRGAVELSNNSDVVLTSYFQHHYNDSANTDEGNNASQTDCQISNPASCGTGLSTITSYYWASESCITDVAINASVDAGTARANAVAKRNAATVAREYADSLAADDPNKTAAENAAVSAENEATAAETTALTSEQNASNALAAQESAWVVDFATAQLSCLPKTDTAHVRLVYKPI